MNIQSGANSDISKENKPTKWLCLLIGQSKVEVFVLTLTWRKNLALPVIRPIGHPFPSVDSSVTMTVPPTAKFLLRRNHFFRSCSIVKHFFFQGTWFSFFIYKVPYIWASILKGTSTKFRLYPNNIKLITKSL